VVATDQYDDPRLHGLAAPGADAEALADVLGDADRGGFEIDVLRNPSSWVTAQHVESLLCDRHPSDLVLLHFSCHGLKDDSGELYLAARNTAPTLLASTAVDTAMVNRLMQRSRAQRVVLLLDCCYGGAFERGVVTRADPSMHVGEQFSQGHLGGGRGRVVITASSAMEYAFEGTDLSITGPPTPSLFTGALVDGLRSGEADRDQDGNVGLDELYEYVFEKVRQRSSKQTPSKWEFGLQGDLFIARNPRRRIVPAPVPREILDLTQHPTAGVRIGAIDELAQLGAGTALPRAAGAALLLRQLQQDDSRRVSEAATAVLSEISLRVSSAVIDLETIPAGGTPVTRDVHVDGSPLALASMVETSSDQIQARLEQSVLHVEITASTPGPLHGWVTLTGPAGDVRIDVTARIVPSISADQESAPAVGGGEGATGEPPANAEPPSAQRAQDSGEPSSTATLLTPAPQGTESTEYTSSVAAFPQRTRLASLTVLLATAAAAIVAAALLAPEVDGFRTAPVRGAGWMFLPAFAVAVAVPGLFFARTRAVALGVVGGAAAWAAGFFLKMTVSALFELEPADLPSVWFNTGLWALAAASLMLAVAVAGALSLSAPQRRTSPLVRDGRAVTAGVLTLCGPALLLVVTVIDEPDSVPRVATLSFVIAAVCLPVAVIGLAVEQRRAALTGVTAFLLFTWGRDVWMLAAGQYNPHFVGTVSCLLLVVSGCFLGAWRTERGSLKH
jgi:hypothetical protein